MMQKIQFPLAVKAVMIDLDGTMLDTVADLAVAVNLMLAKLGRGPLDETLVRNFVGKGIPNLVQRALVGRMEGEVDPDLFARALPVYLDCYESVNGRHTLMYPGVQAGLDALKAAGFPLACVTNKSARFTLPLLRQMRLADYFACRGVRRYAAQKKARPAAAHACVHGAGHRAARNADDRRLVERHDRRARRGLPGFLRALWLQRGARCARTGR
jgi:phosphoglycolate phosphatase